MAARGRGFLEDFGLVGTKVRGEEVGQCPVSRLPAPHK